MRRGFLGKTAIAALALVGTSGVAVAQMPVCPDPDPKAPVWSICAPAGRYVTIAFLSNLAIDQLLRGDSGALEREPRKVFESVVDGDTFEQQETLANWLGTLKPLRLTRLDTATGTFVLDTEEDRRKFASPLEVAGLPHDVSVGLPARLEGGYWRTPGVLQMAFWKEHRARVSVKSPAAGTFEAEIECAVVSADGVRLVTAGEETADVLLGFGPCP